MMGVLALSFSWVLALVAVQQNLTASMSAQAIADAVALAAVDHGESVARQLAELNDARIVSLTFDNDAGSRSAGQVGEMVSVVIDVDGVQARATASTTP